MSVTQTDLFFANKAKFFPQESLRSIKEILDTLEEKDLYMINSLDLKDPTMYLIISVVGGTLGIDRFMIGDMGMGVLKLLTGGLCGILTIYDWFIISNRVKQQNLQMFLNLV
ncbi:MAG: TM2 domain-containing protein [Erysipelothrix sp.]|nr:TM2 domain-containing protein [Erysipelothrix sp.]